jgi:DNA-binding transcriptional ArsR family regulator
LQEEKEQKRSKVPLQDEIKMDRQVFEALASETRIEILKKLDERQMTISELSREMDMAKSSIHEHLVKMVQSGLVAKFDNGHKWTYYHLTGKGRKILHPHETAKILVFLGVAIIAIASGVTNILNVLTLGSAAAPMAEKAVMSEAAPVTTGEAEMAALSESARATEPAVSGTEPSLLIGVVLIASGIALAYISYRMWRRGRPKRFKQKPSN